MLTLCGRRVVSDSEDEPVAVDHNMHCVQLEQHDSN